MLDAAAAANHTGTAPGDEMEGENDHRNLHLHTIFTPCLKVSSANKKLLYIVYYIC